MLAKKGEKLNLKETEAEVYLILLMYYFPMTRRLLCSTRWHWVSVLTEARVVFHSAGNAAQLAKHKVTDLAAFKISTG